MKKKSQLLKAVVGIAVALFSVGAVFAEEFKEIRVTSSLEFLEALGSNRMIAIAEDADINLSDILSSDDLLNLAGISFEEQAQNVDAQKEIKYAKSVFDGKELVLRNIKNMSIVGDGDGMSKIVTDPRYANLFRLENCSNITFANVSIGHTDKGECEGGVLYLEGCSNIKINMCDLYGCGIEGITAYNTHALKLYYSTIRDCACSAVQLVACSGFHFLEDKIYGNGSYGCFRIEQDCKDVVFEKCEIRDNAGALFLVFAPTVFRECTISHFNDLGLTVHVVKENCKLTKEVEDGWDDAGYCTEDPDAIMD